MPAPLDLATVAAAGILVYATALVAHEAAHALAGWSAGASPTLISSTDTRGDFSELGPPGLVWTAVSGSLANVVLAGLGGLGFRRGAGAPGPWTAVLWLMFAVNAWIPSTYLVVSPLFGFGDWHTLVGAFPNQGPLRASLTVTGLFVCGVLWQRTVPSLARLVGGGERDARQERGRRVVRTAWLAGGGLAVAASLLSPLDAAWAVSVAVGSTFLATCPLLLAARRVREHPVPGAPLRIPRAPGLLAMGVLAGLVLVLVFGPGIRL
ncbi:MAG: hypothetical protein R3304_02605 [Longimicrobiales bacterium]|nr:hypothetical protein [Longimicrobiales bacterium]